MRLVELAYLDARVGAHIKVDVVTAIKKVFALAVFS